MKILIHAVIMVTHILQELISMNQLINMKLSFLKTTVLFDVLDFIEIIIFHAKTKQKQKQNKIYNMLCIL